MAVIWIVMAALVVALIVGLRAANKPERTRPQAVIRAAPVAHLPGDGDFETDIVGESHHQADLAWITGGHTRGGHEYVCVAELVPEPGNPYDANAVAVHIKGRKVGHLPRDLAAMFVGQLEKRGWEGRRLSCDAMVVGGWRKGDDEGLFGVKLDLLEDDLENLDDLNA